MEELRELRDEAKQRGQLSAAIQAEVKRGELRRFYVKQVESRDAGDFSRMSDDELREIIVAQDKILASLKHLNSDDRTRRLDYARHHSFSPRFEVKPAG